MEYTIATASFASQMSRYTWKPQMQRSLVYFLDVILCKTCIYFCGDIFLWQTQATKIFQHRNCPHKSFPNYGCWYSLMYVYTYTDIYHIIAIWMCAHRLYYSHGSFVRVSVTANIFNLFCHRWPMIGPCQELQKIWTNTCSYRSVIIHAAT